MSRQSTVLSVLAVLFLSTPLVASADDAVADTTTPTQDQLRDQDQDREQDKLTEGDREQLRTHLRKKLKFSEAEIEGLDPLVNRYFRLHGEQANVRAMIEAGAQAGCTGVCLQEMVRSTNRAMVWGMQDNEATALVTECLQDRIRDRDRTGAKWTDADLQDQLHDQVQDRIRLWERDQQRLMENEQKHEEERQRQREMQRSNERSSTMQRSGSGR